MKIGRNQPCTCNSGKKYKRCCGSIQNENLGSKRNPYAQPMPPELLLAIKKKKADELIRQQQQGLGKPIVSAKLKDHQMVAIGDKIHYSKKWKTFPDFLSSYFKLIIGAEWGNAEIAKPLAERHQILQWYEEYCHYQRKYGVSGEIKETPMTGIVYCHMGLAYNLYLIKHNVELQERLLKRLKDPKQFQGAYYELMVANFLIRAGFKLELEDETDGKTKHCEFSAVSLKTGKKYWVEAKMRGVVGLLGKTSSDGTTNEDATSSLIKHLNGAFSKPAADERLIFIDVNTIPTTDKNPVWVTKAAKRLEEYEKKLQDGQSAYVLITNMAHHRALQSEGVSCAIMAHGLGNDFWKAGPCRLSDIYRRKQKHIDVHNLIEAMQKYPQIPITFDGSLPSETLRNQRERIVVGQTYFFNDIGEKGITGTVTSACVNEGEKKIYICVQAENGSHILTEPMSDYAMADYKRHPEAYFGEIGRASRKTEDPYELFEFFLETYSQTPKEKLLEFMQGAADIESLRQLDQMDLAIEYCDRLATSIANDNLKKHKTG